MAELQRAVAVVVSVDVSSSLASSNPSLIEGMLQRFSAEKWVVSLEVHPDSGEIFTVERRYSVPKSILGGSVGSTWRPEVGQRLPVLVDPARPDSLVLDGDPIGPSSS